MINAETVRELAHLADAPVSLGPDSGPTVMPFGPTGATLATPVVVRTRRHDFADLDGFAAFVTRSVPDFADILVADGSVTADAQPGIKESDVVTCRIGRHPRFSRWEAILGKPVSQRTLLRLVATSDEDFCRVEGADGKDLGSQGQRILDQLGRVASGKNTETTVTYDTSGALLVASTTAGQTLSAKLPADFWLRLPLVKGARDDAGAYVETEIRIFIEIDTEGAQPTFTLQAPALSVALDEAFEAAARYLAGKLPGHLVVRGVAKSERVATGAFVESVK